MTTAISTIALSVLVLGLSGAAQAAGNYQVIRALGIPVTYSPLIHDAAGNLYGITYNGGNYDAGTVYKVAEDGSGFAILHSFDGSAGGANPYGALTLGSDGNLYGTTEKGGASGEGTVFRIAPNGSGFTVLHSFDGIGGASPYAALVEGSGGNFYGTTYHGGAKDEGTVYRLASGGSGFMVLHSFDSSLGEGANPQAELTQGQGGDVNLYGTTTEGGASALGTVYKIAPDGLGFQVLHSFDGSALDGAGSYSGLIPASGGNFYGATVGGGATKNGVVYEIAADGSGFRVLHSFDGTNEGASPMGNLTLDNGNLYGTTVNAGKYLFGTVYKLTPVPGGSDFTFEVLHSFAGANDGEHPYAGLTMGNDGNLYGTTIYGGVALSKVYRVSPSALAPAEADFAVIHSFDGIYRANLFAGLTLGSDGDLYGTSLSAQDFGSVYKIDQTGSVFALLHSFNFEGGASPYGGLTLGSDGRFYGTTVAGGGATTGYGTIYSIDPSGSDFRSLHAFDLTNDGGVPFGELTEGADGEFYGTASTGGTNNFGTVYKIAKDGAFTLLHSFDATNGKYPQAGLSLGSDNNFYGTAYNGGANDLGTIFEFAPTGTSLMLSHSFDGTEGSHPAARLLPGPDGSLYGTTREGGISSVGTVFKLQPSEPPESALTVLHSFDGTNDGADPYAGLTFGGDGRLYGTTHSGGSGGHGTVYAIATDGSGFSVLHSFDYSSGGDPFAGLTVGSDGNLYGTTFSGTQYGVIYRVCPTTCSITTLTSNLNPSTFDAPVTFTATVTGSAPGGTVTFKRGTITLGTGSVIGGAASYTTSELALGISSITAAYGGDANNSASTSTVLSQVVGKASTATTLSSSLNPSTSGASVTFTATVSGNAATGTVTFKDGGSTLGTGSVSGGQATYETDSLSVGTHSITAEYGGDSNYLPSSSTAVDQVVNRASTTTAIQSSLNPSTVGASVTFTATVTGSNPMGTVIFKDGTATLDTVGLRGGQASYTTSSLGFGTHSITARYSGDTNNSPSDSPALDQVVVGAYSTTTTLKSRPNPSKVGASVTFTATVTGMKPTGTVDFYVDKAATPSGTGTLRKGKADYTTKFAIPITHTVVAKYSGDSNNAASISLPLIQTVRNK